MLASVLNSDRAITVNIQIVKAFIKYAKDMNINIEDIYK